MARRAAAQLVTDDYDGEDETDTAQSEASAMDDSYIIRRIQRHLKRGINSDEGEITDVRQVMFNTYLGMEYGNEREGYSRVVTREVLQAVEWALPSLMRIFLGGIKAVEFKPSGPNDVVQAKHETDVVNHHFFDGNPKSSGFLTLYNFLKDLFLYPNAYLKAEVEEDTEQDTTHKTDVLPGELEVLYRDNAGGEIQVRNGRIVAGVQTYDVVVTKDDVQRRIAVSVVAPDAVVIDGGQRDLSLDRARFACIRTEETYSDLRKAGYSEEELADCDHGGDDELWKDEEVNRYFYVDEQDQDGEDEDDLAADKLYQVHECYMELDYDGDGISERRRIVMAGRAIIANEPFEYQPMVAGSMMPMPHKHVGMGMAEIVADLQKIMTALTRNLLDNIYGQNVQRVYMAESAMLSNNATMDAFLDRTTEVIPVRGSPQNAVMPEQITPIVAEIVQAIEVFKDQPQLRTGVAPNLSLDPSVLEKATMGAFVGALDQASQRLELIGRIVAETVLVPLFQKVHYLLREHFEGKQQVEINGQWVEVDPSTWKKRSAMKVNVGLGFNNKQMMLMLLKELLMIQREALPLGLADAKKIYATLDKLVEQANLGHAGTFFNDPNVPGFAPPPPPKDAAMIMAEAQSEALRAEIKRKDRELQVLEAEKNEAAEAKAAELLNNFFAKAGMPAKTQAEIAKIMAEITHLNRAEKNQAGPAEDSSQDEMEAAGNMVGEPGSHYGPPKATTATPDKLEAKKPNGKPAE